MPCKFDHFIARLKAERAVPAARPRPDGRSPVDPWPGIGPILEALRQTSSKSRRRAKRI